MVGVRWYLRYGLSYRDVEELLAERGSRSTMRYEDLGPTTSTREPFIGAAGASRHSDIAHGGLRLGLSLVRMEQLQAVQVLQAAHGEWVRPRQLR